MPRLLIVKTSSLGDVIHNLPILADIRARFPDMQFDWMVEEAFAEIPAMHPAVDKVIPVAIRRWRKNLFSQATWREMAAFNKSLKERTYDVVLDTQGLLKSALLASLGRGPRHGQDRRSAREAGAALFYQHVHPVPRGRHAVARNRQLAALALGYPEPDSPPDYGLRIAESTVATDFPPRYVVGLHATSRDSKLWPQEHWIDLGKQLAAQDLPLVLPWGNDKELARARAIAANVPHAIVPPRMSLRELAALLTGARGVIGVDTGLVHLAVALGVPTVALYIRSDHVLTGAYPADCMLSRNLGGMDQIPDVASVLAAFHSIIDQETKKS